MTQSTSNQLDFTPSARQLEVLQNYGIVGFNGTRAEASKLIEQCASERALAPATPAQLARLDYLHGRALPGAGKREVSTSITLLIALAQYRQGAISADQFAAAVADRLEKQSSITKQ